MLGGRCWRKREWDPVQGTGSARSRCSNCLRILSATGTEARHVGWGTDGEASRKV